MSLLILEHYRRNGIAEGWPKARALRLAKLLGVTIDELGRLCGLFSAGAKRQCLRQTMATQMQRGRFTPCASLHFAYLEAWVVDKLKLKIRTTPSPMPLNLITTPKDWMESAVEAQP